MMTMVKRAKTIKDKKGRTQSRAIFICSYCGQEVERHLSAAANQSCGCVAAQLITAKTTKHGDHGSNLYKRWDAMMQRCNNKKCHGYLHYGGRGVSVCEEWKNYANFKEWAKSNGYKRTLTIDRINNDGNYEPDNCRWVTHQENSQNRRGQKLRKVDACNIRVLRETGMSAIGVATIYGISERYVNQVEKKVCWGNT